jgi:hypothetical protein
MTYRVTMIVTREPGSRRSMGRPEPAGVTEVCVTKRVEAMSWANAVAQATETLMDDLSALTGGPVGYQLMSMEVRAA